MVLLTSLVQTEAFWVLMPCTVVVQHQRFRGLCCLIFKVKWMALQKRARTRARVCGPEVQESSSQ